VRWVYSAREGGSPSEAKRRARGQKYWLALVALAGCATTGQQQSEDKPVVKMDPLLIRSETDPLTGLDGYDAPQLLDLGNQLYEKNQADQAIQVYDRLLEHFADSEHVPPALYNKGLAFEKLAEFEKALACYQLILERHDRSKSHRDAYFRTALMYGKLSRWKEVADTFWQIRQLGDLNTIDEIEARVGQGVGMFMQNDHATAESEFMGALRFYEEHKKEEYLPVDYWIGQARFYLGEIYAREFESRKLSEPNLDEDQWADMMGKELEEKCELLLRAQNNFIRTIRIGHTGWATAAGFRIGSLYEKLYDDLIGVPTPPSLSDDGKKFYLEELRKKVGVLVMKAIQIYERSLEMAQRVGEENEWVKRTSASLERMKSLAMAQIDADQ
jgi:tetratricopeptide (TPR) repeat protein